VALRYKGALSVLRFPIGTVLLGDEERKAIRRGDGSQETIATETAE
jgi:hypothetical protein